MEGVMVAKSKRKKPGPKPRPEGQRKAAVAFKCFDEYKAWIDRIAEEDRTTPGHIIDMALTMWARTNKRPTPPRR